MSEHLLIGLASIIVLGISASWLAWRIKVPSILILLLTGIIAGPLTGFLDPDQLFGELLFPLVSVSVGIILFQGGLSLRRDELARIGGVVGALVTIGALVTWLLSAAAAHLLLRLSLPTALLLGAILVVTGPTVIIPLLRHVQPEPRLASTLRWEGILIDPIGAVLAVLIFEAVLARGVQEATTLALLALLETLAIGLLIASAGAGTLILLLKNDWVPEYLQSPVTLALVVAAFAASNVLQAETGLLTATLMGVVLTNQKAVDVKHIIEFKENLGVLLVSSLFVLLAAQLQLSDLQAIGVPHLAFLAVLIFAVRPLAVMLSTVRSQFNWRERAFLASVAPRGIVAAAVSSVLALELSRAGYPDARLLVTITFLVIVGTVLVYGLTATPAARLLGVAHPNPQGVLFLGSHRWARQIASKLQYEGVAVCMMDSNYANIAAARMAGLPTYYGNSLSENAHDLVDLAGLGRLLALTGNEEVNSLAALNFSEAFGDKEIYQLPHENEAGGASPSGVARHLRGRFLFHASASFSELSERFARGAQVKSTNITSEYDLETFQADYPGSIPLFVLGEKGKVIVYTAKAPPAVHPGQRLLAIVNVKE